jgi:hypothetical protein
MALVVATLKNDIKTAFQATDWAVCATQLATAIDTFIKSGTVTIPVTLTLHTPGGDVPGSATGIANAINTTGMAAMQAAILAKFQSSSTMWVDLGPSLATAISTNVKTGMVNTTVSTPPIVGTGTGAPGCINDSAGLSGLIANITTAFSTQAFASDWNAVGDKIGDSVDQYLKAAKVTTTDGGSAPYPWNGDGIDGIIS